MIELVFIVDALANRSSVSTAGEADYVSLGMKARESSKYQRTQVS